MIYIISAHLGDKWIKVQEEYIKENTKEPYKYIQHLVTDGANHLRSLTRMYNKIKELKPDSGDMIVIMDSDAFPISEDWVKKTEELLIGNKFASVQRLENPLHYREYPHLSFTAWYYGEMPDMEFRWTSMCPYVCGWEEMKWAKILRTNKVNLHLQLYAIYGDMIYHHGAGSREVADEDFFKDGLSYYDKFWDDTDSFIKALR